MRQGTTLIELAVVLAIVGIIVGVAAPSFRGLRDRIAVQGATTDLLSALALARHTAVATSGYAAVHVSAVAGTVAVVAGRDTLQRRTLGIVHRVTLDATRDSVAYGPTGRGYGAGNTSIIVSRGRVSDTVFVSRLGRVRH